MIKAGSLYYSIIICVLVGVCCMSFLMLSSYAKIHGTMLTSQHELLDNNNSAINYFLTRVPELNAEKEVDIFDNGMLSKAIAYNWGFYKVLKVSTSFKSDTIEKISLLGVKKSDSTALYLSDNNKSLRMVGEAKIIGEAFLPQKGIEKGYLNNSRAFNNKTFLYGLQRKSGKKLPLNSNSFYLKDSINYTKSIDKINDKQLYYNNFTKPTLEIKVNRASINNKILAGNIVLKSYDSLYIRKGNEFNNIIISAPIIIFEKGFVGSVQVKASKKVILEEDVMLKYPSGIFIEGDTELKMQVYLKEKAKLTGSIVLTGDNSLGAIGRRVSIEKKALVVGDVYCYGGTELKGKIIGSLFTDSFYLKTDASSYENYIQEGIIDRKSLPSFYLGTNLANKEYNVKYGVIKEL